MRKIQAYPFHLCCVAGPDAGLLYPLPLGEFFRGRQTSLALCADADSLLAPTCSLASFSPDSSFSAPISDLATSRVHARFVVSSQRVLVEDMGAKNPLFVGKSWGFLPGFPRSWVRLKAVGEMTELSVGELLLMGENLFELRRPDAAYVFTSEKDASATATREKGFPSRLRYFFMGVLPLFSLGFWLSRWVPGVFLLGVALFLGAGTAYWSAATRQQKKFTKPWEFSYLPHLPVNRQSHSSATGLSLQLPPQRKLRLWRFRTRAYGRWKLQENCVLPQIPKGNIKIVAAESSFPWALTMGLAGLLYLKFQGHASKLEVREETVELTATPPNGREELKWSFIPAKTTEDFPNTDLCLWFTQTPPLSGGALQQLHGIYAAKTTGSKQLLTVEALNQLTLKENLGGLAVPVGIDNFGNAVWLNLVADGPHAMICGTTGSGKSVALRTWIQQLCTYYTPQQLRLILFDYKGGAALAPYTQLPHSAGLITDLDPLLAVRVFYALRSELRQRELDLQEKGYADIAQWEENSPLDCPPRLLCVVDEYKVMALTHPRDVDTLLDLTARGRSLGIHLLLATQSAAGVITSQMRANLGLRVCFRTATPADSLDLLGNTDAFALEKAGQAWVSTAGGELQQMQWAIAEETDLGHRGLTGEKTSSDFADSKPGKQLWKPPLNSSLAEETSREIREQSEPAGRHLLAVLDDLPNRVYRPLYWERNVLAVVASSMQLRELLKKMAPTESVFLDEYPEKEWGVQANNAVAAEKPVVIADLHYFCEVFDAQFGVGTGRTVFEQWCRRGKRVLAGVDPGDFGLCRLVEQVLVKTSSYVGKQLGWEPTVWKFLETFEAPLCFGEDTTVAVLRWTGLPVPAGLAQVVSPLESAKETVEGYGDSQVTVYYGSEAAISDKQREEKTEIVWKPFTATTSTEWENTQNESLQTGFCGLNSLEVRALNPPYFMKKLLLDSRDIWVCENGFWRRYTN